VGSILGQTFQDFEFIIIDDGSTDRTAAILDEFKDPRIRRIKNTINLGLVASLNRGIAEARGQYIARMDADDISFRERLSLQVDYLDSHPEIGVLGTMIEIMEPDGSLNCTEDWHVSHAADPDIVRWQLYFHDPISHPTVMMRKSILDLYGAYDSKDRHAEDYGLWIRLSHHTNITNLNQVLLRYRWHDSNISKLNGMEQMKRTMDIRFRAAAFLISGSMRHMVENDHVNFQESVDSDLHWARIYYPLYRAHIRKYHTTIGVRLRIRSYAGRMIMRHAKKHLGNPSFWWLIILACWLDPFFLNTAYDMRRRRKIMQSLADRRRKELFAIAVSLLSTVLG
jgi:glycosyltransferase involved in cell wall biosynthesis